MKVSTLFQCAISMLLALLLLSSGVSARRTRVPLINLGLRSPAAGVGANVGANTLFNISNRQILTPDGIRMTQLRETMPNLLGPPLVFREDDALPEELQRIILTGPSSEEFALVTNLLSQVFNLVGAIFATVGGGFSVGASQIGLLLSQYSALTDPIALGLEAESFLMGLASDTRDQRDEILDQWSVNTKRLAELTAKYGRGSDSLETVMEALQSGSLVSQMVTLLGNFQGGIRLLDGLTQRFSN